MMNLKFLDTNSPLLKSPRFIITPKQINWFFLSLFFILIGFYFFYQINLFLSPPQVTLLTPEDNIETRENKIKFQGTVSPDSNLIINNQEIYINKNGGFDQEINLIEGLNIIHLVAINQFNKKTILIKNIYYTP